MKKHNFRSLVLVLGLVFCWKLMHVVISYFAISLFEFTPTFPYAHELLPKFGDRLLTTWAHFDGVHYLTISEKGYFGTGLIQAFFPLYPMLVSVLSFFGTLNLILVGMLISLTGFCLSLFFLNKNQQILSIVSWQWLAGFLLVFPTSFFFGSVYTEGLFLMLLVLCWHFLQSKQPIYAGLTALFASLTRLTGVFLILPLFSYAWKEDRLHSRRSKLIVLLPLLGLVGYMVYLGITFDDPLLFYSVQESFGAERSSGGLILLPQVFFRYFKMLTTVPILSFGYWALLQELLLTCLALLGLVMGYKKVPRSWWWFGLISLLLPTLTGTLSSMPRYLLTAFPVFLGLFIGMKKWQYYVLVTLLAIMQVINIILFTRGIWVA